MYHNVLFNNNTTNNNNNGKSLTNGRGSWVVGVGVGEELIMILNKGTYEEVQLIIWCTLSR